MKGLISRLLKSKMNNKDSSLKSPLLRYAVSGGVGFLMFLLPIVLFCVILFGPIMIANEYLDSFKSSASSFFEKVGNLVTFKGWCTDEECARNSEQLYQEKLKEVYDSYKEDGVEIDVDLITATVYYHSAFEDKFSDDVGEEDNSYELTETVNVSDVKKLASNMVSGSSIDYDRYRNYLVSTYIPKRYSDLYSNDIEKENIADEIMMYAQKEYVNNRLNGFPTIASTCTSITYKDAKGKIIPLELEEFVAGSVSSENDYGTESAKLQAILTRTRVVAMCDKVIDGTKDSSYKTPTQKGIDSAKATEGMVLVYDGKILDSASSSYASFPQANFSLQENYPGFYDKVGNCKDVVCSVEDDGRTWCSTSLFKTPGLEEFKVKMPNTDLNGTKYGDGDLWNQKGHCVGASQDLSRYYENELHYTVEDMVKEFYSDGVGISKLSDMFANYTGEVASTKGTKFLPYQLDRFLNERGTNVIAFNESIKQAVVSSGPGTRAGVVAAANALISGLSQYGVKLPYISSTGGSGTASGKYSGYGVAPDWGKNGAWYSSTYNRTYTQTGLDCSGFVSWAIHNGGYRYLKYSSTSYDGVSPSYQNAVGPMYSSRLFTAQAGDLLWHTGHIMFVLGVSEDGGYIIGEEKGGEDGLVVTYRSKNTSDKIIDMTGFYSNLKNINLDYYQGG